MFDENSEAGAHSADSLATLTVVVIGQALLKLAQAVIGDAFDRLCGSAIERAVVDASASESAHALPLPPAAYALVEVRAQLVHMLALCYHPNIMQWGYQMVLLC
jgi:hypothetical protein